MIIQAVGSVNADRRPDLREDIMNDSFQDATCEKCTETFRLQPEFNYLDVARGQWVSAMPTDRLLDYLEIEDETTALFAASYGANAPKAAQEVGDDLTVRLTFGWPALREKLFAAENEIDDTVLELTKLDILRRVPEAPLAPGVAMRLVGLQDESMVFLWIRSDTEETLQELNVQRQLYDSIKENTEGWASVSSQLTNGPFVDMQKLYLGEGRS
jgi:hypothetical protein